MPAGIDERLGEIDQQIRIIGVQLKRPLILGDREIEIPPVVAAEGEEGMGQIVVGVELDGALRIGFGERLGIVLAPSIQPFLQIDIGERAPGAAVERVEGRRLLEPAARAASSSSLRVEKRWRPRR